ncbi:hypothetical protein Ancab_034655 [Ancistrocladus abbreviatus]
MELKISLLLAIIAIIMPTLQGQVKIASAPQDQANTAPPLQGQAMAMPPPREVSDELEWWKLQHKKAYESSVSVVHPEPEEEVSNFNQDVHLALDGSNSTRRGLGKKYKGECQAQNPIDKCWRCRANWAKERKKLAKCVRGFGRNTTGGLAGDFYVVTDPSDNDLVNPVPGTLRFGVLQPRPLWITFAHDMNIKLKGELLVTSDKTIDGRGATVHIANGSGISIQFAHNIIIHNIRIHDIVPASGGMIKDTWDHVGLRGADDGDGISIFTSHNIWIDHLSMWNCKDGLIDAVSASTAITVSNCHFTRHNDVMLFGASDKDPRDEIMQATIAFNHFGKGLIQRMPRCRFGFFHVVNNDYTHWEMYAIGGTSHPTIISQGNRFIAPPDPKAKQITNRNNVVGEDWRSWTWRSEDDLMLNGAYFIESGAPLKKKPSSKYLIKAKPGSYVRRLTRFAGFLRCTEGKKC